MNTPGRTRAPHALLPSPDPTEPPATHAPPPFSPTSPALPQWSPLCHVHVQNAGHHLTLRGNIWTKPHRQHLLHKHQPPRTLGTSDLPAVTGTPLAKRRRQRLDGHTTRPRRRLRNAHGGLCKTTGARSAASRRRRGGTPNLRQRWGGAATARSRLVTADALPPLRRIYWSTTRVREGQRCGTVGASRSRHCRPCPQTLPVTAGSGCLSARACRMTRTQTRQARGLCRGRGGGRDARLGKDDSRRSRTCPPPPEGHQRSAPRRRGQRAAASVPLPLERRCSA